MYMKFLMVVPYYVSWHYSQGFIDVARNLFNFIEFEFHFFSVKDLLLTLFSPFQRLKENYGGNPIDIEAILSVLLVNIIMRAVGFVVRATILIFAAIVITLSSLLSLLIILLWVVLPVVLCVIIVGSLFGYFKYRP